MIWDFLPPGVLVALLRSWHAAPSRDETVLLASYQRPTDWGHVSARLSVNNCSSPPLAFALSFYSFSIICSLSLTSRTLWISVHRFSTLQPNSFFPHLFLSFLWGFYFSSSSLKTLCFCSRLFLAAAETLQPGWLVQLMSDTAPPVCHEWGEANADPSSHHNTKRKQVYLTIQPTQNALRATLQITSVS